MNIFRYRTGNRDEYVQVYRAGNTVFGVGFVLLLRDSSSFLVCNESSELETHFSYFI